jgi:glycosyltransferase involved in cell wall biosynthesis
MSKEQPTLSFVIPVYKKDPGTFEKCLVSLFDQSFKDIEVICVFDGPDPVLEEVAKRFKVQSLVIEHGGAPKARNAGFMASGGKFISFWDADCFAKPEMAQMWMNTFERNPDAAFVYSGYEFENEEGGYDSEQFDAYSLQCGNFIASMFPVKREFFPGWDESLKAAQDWDFWLSVVEKGGKGVFLQGYGFVTELPKKGSISHEGWSTENREATIRAVRNKHGIPDRDIAVYGMVHHIKALHLAKLLGGDQLKGSSLPIKTYKMVLNLGYSQMIRFEGVDKDAVKVHYWLPWDIDCLYEIAHRVARETIRLANAEITHQFCNDIISQKRLKDLGIDAEILPLPTEIDDLETALPDEFRVLIDADEAHKPIVANIFKDIPYIPIDNLEVAADIKKYSLLVSFHENPYADEGIKRFLLNGRNIISNVQAPFCGYFDLEVNHTEFRRELITRIRLAREYPFNKEAQDYYRTIVDPSKFKERILGLLPKPVLEVVA